MQAKTYDITVPIRRGAHFPLGLLARVKDIFGEKVRYLDLTDAVITWTIRNAPADLVGTNAPGGALTVTLATSRIDWLLTPDQTSALTLGRHSYSVLAALNTGLTISLLSGTISVED